MPEPEPKDYQAVLECRNCKSKRYVPKSAEPFRYWFCHYTDEGEECWTHNIWNQEEATE